MSGIATAIVGGAVVGAVASNMAAGEAADASRDAAQTSASAQMEQLNYLKEIEAVPQEMREQAIKQLGGIAGFEGGEGNQADLIARAKQSPMYQELLGGREAGEDAIMRQAGATGGLRSGNVQSALAGFNTQLENQALTQSYNQQLQGLQGLAGLPSNANQIGNVMAGIGGTLASGQIAAGQAQQAGLQGISTAIGTGVGQYVTAKGQGII